MLCCCPAGAQARAYSDTPLAHPERAHGHPRVIRTHTAASFREEPKSGVLLVETTGISSFLLRSLFASSPFPLGLLVQSWVWNPSNSSGCFISEKLGWSGSSHFSVSNQVGHQLEAPGSKDLRRSGCSEVSKLRSWSIRLGATGHCAQDPTQTHQRFTADRPSSGRHPSPGECPLKSAVLSLWLSGPSPGG